MSGKEDVISSEGYAGDSPHDGIITRAVAHLFQVLRDLLRHP